MSQLITHEVPKIVGDNLMLGTLIDESSFLAGGALRAIETAHNSPLHELTAQANAATYDDNEWRMHLHGALKDLDIYSIDEDALIRVLANLDKAEIFIVSETYLTDNSVGYKMLPRKTKNEGIPFSAFGSDFNESDLDFIKRVFGKPEAILQNFDFTVCRKALLRRADGSYYSLEDPLYASHLQQRILTTTAPLEEGRGQMERLLRYVGYGFVPTEELLRETLERTLDFYHYSSHSVDEIYTALAEAAASTEFTDQPQHDPTAARIGIFLSRVLGANSHEQDSYSSKVGIEIAFLHFIEAFMGKVVTEDLNKLKHKLEEELRDAWGSDFPIYRTFNAELAYVNLLALLKEHKTTIDSSAAIKLMQRFNDGAPIMTIAEDHSPTCGRCRRMLRGTLCESENRSHLKGQSSRASELFVIYHLLSNASSPEEFNETMCFFNEIPLVQSAFYLHINEWTQWIRAGVDVRVPYSLGSLFYLSEPVDRSIVARAKALQMERNSGF